MTGRLAIEDIRPRISGGSQPSKAVVGEMIPVSALVWREGHDAVSATLNVTSPSGQVTRTIMTSTPFDQDKMFSSFVPDALGTWSFRVDAWSDPMSTWRHAVIAKIEVGQDEDDLFNDLEHGAQLFEKAAANAPKSTAQKLFAVADSLRSSQPLRARVAPALSKEIHSILREHPVRELLTRGQSHTVLVERRDAQFSSWYELFPRSTGGWDADGNPVHGTFSTTAQALKRVASMGFDTVYFPPIHPIGTVHRKGKNNTLIAEPGDVGSPWAIGSADGGHDAVHPQLGTLKDFQELVSTAKKLGLNIALDLALQAAPDHPWARTHQDFFTVLADGTIAYAENPPKKYQDIYPLNFDNNKSAIYAELKRIVLFWIAQGITVFRVDNPHTKPANFWEWLISTIHETHPEVIFLAEAFTRPARLYGLGKLGFTQSYTYFTWRTTKSELEEFGTEIAAMADSSRPNLFVNTPDILHESLQHGGRAMFAIRAALAATLSPLWGVYSGFELYEHEAVSPGSEEYMDSEKYELRPRDFAAALEQGNSLEPYIGALNAIRRAHPALQQLRIIDFHSTDNDNIIAYSKVDPVSGDAVLVVVNLDPEHAHAATVDLTMSAIGCEDTDHFTVTDLVTGAHFPWNKRTYVRLDPCADVAHILQLPVVDESKREALSWRTPTDYSN
ncbi:Alpha-1,4-glucan:maltose-1-phosphate maltosyltransferase [Corynebacterium ulcerans]|uniref:alpha-1,4-glucan--maltose-1-phosphate maltosyltransferase n=1 Tax=Corynebacterium ulcerans TaxID=65058 RepID=UPI000521132F|nr:alpha-1,4-glucan--maltose-1-phosphate maltosyltransferase [Corynebacterium ulcerans]AIU30260.1 Alpha-1,4-glucan:maltose-1-phosphate maltosyltransferase [Corynebacterium ulcerans]AIU91549.1 Alpha-1,4-glucan:maltose-1-phosphate maltosyltransferase [Corynebacterium ulcerans]NOL61813.1 alpha-1,4-glucan--maltose-1-phosphate maltosyltransferase [Corynebacterium ulcerans]NON17554.1 alpha-1,4-glucan--maltose-1-phosphate maltosyltransferase [Corynebacterium ulcerans]